jgi:hypothetical protein
VSAPAAHAAPAWLPAQAVSSPVEAPNGVHPVVKMGPSGDIAAAWVDASGVHAGVRQAGASSFSQEVISTPGDHVEGPSVAINASGTVVVVWIDYTTKRYEVAIRQRGQAFSAPIAAGSTGGGLQTSTSVAIDDAGDVLLGEYEERIGGGVVAYAWQPTGGTFTVQAVSEPSEEASDTMVALNGAGAAIVAWWARVGGPHTVVKTITRPAGGAFGTTPQSLSNNAKYAFNIAVAIGAGGQPAVAWQYGTTAPPYRIEASTAASPSEPLDAARVISPEGSNDTLPAVAVGGNGEAIVAWQHAGTTETVDAASATAGGAFAPAVEVSANGSSGTPSVAADGAGDAVIGWTATPAGVESVEAVTRTAAGALGPEVTLSAAGEKVNYELRTGASVAMDSAGDALVGWEEGLEHFIQVRVYEATRPPEQHIVQPPPPIPCAVESVSPAAAPCPHFVFGGCGGPPLPEPAILCARRCRVPQLAGLTRAAARLRLAANRCSLGTVRVSKRYRRRKRLVVRAQSAKSGASLTAGAPVSVTLGPPPPRHKKHRRR